MVGFNHIAWFRSLTLTKIFIFKSQFQPECSLNSNFSRTSLEFCIPPPFFSSWSNSDSVQEGTAEVERKDSAGPFAAANPKEPQLNCNQGLCLPGFSLSQKLYVWLL